MAGVTTLEPRQLKARRRLALNLRRLRESKGYSQQEAAERIGCSVQGYQRAERAVARVTVDLMADFAKGYGVDLAELFVPAGRWHEPKPGRPSRVS